MKCKALVSGIAVLSLMGLSACGGGKKDKEDTDASVVVISDSGVTDSDASGPSDDAGSESDAGVSDAGEADAGPEEDAGPGGCPAEKPYKVGGECYAENDECDENFPEGCVNGDALYCNSEGRVTVLECGEGTTCGVATDKLEIDWDGNYAWGVDCMIPCEQSGDEFTLCGEDEYAGYEIEYACSRLKGGGLGAYWRDESLCRHGCDTDEGACILLDPDEGHWCTPTGYSDVEPYQQHCAGEDVAVFCAVNEVVVGICNREEGYTCHALPDGSYAGCYSADDLCDSPGAVSGKQCFVWMDGVEFVVTYTCRATTDAGVNVWVMNSDNAEDYEQCATNCVAPTQTEEAHCGQLDSRIGQACTKEEADAGNICGQGGIILSCYSDGTERTWHSAENCAGQNKVCLSSKAGGAVACYDSSSNCTQGDADTHHCFEEEVLGNMLMMSFTYSCTEMNDGSFHRVSSDSDNCGTKGCNEGTGLCNQ